MSKQNVPFTSRNGGEIGQEIQGRVQLEGYPATAALLENFMPDTAGQSHFRPGLKFCVTGPAAGNGGRIEPFYFDQEQKNLIWFSNGELRFVENEGVIITLPVTSTVGNGIFASGLASWTDFSGGSSTATGSVAGLTLDGDGATAAGVRQSVSTSSAGTQHSLRISVTRGPVTFKCGSSSGGDDYVSTATLRAGEFVFSFTPSGSYWVEFSSTLDRQVIVQEIEVLGSGDLVLSTSWDATEIQKLRLEPSLDVMYVADGVNAKRRIERYGPSSWGLAVVQETDGPFLSPNVDETWLLTPSVLVGNGTLTASRALFKAAHVGALFQLTHTGQSESRTATGADQWSSPILVTGVGLGRSISWVVSGTYSGTVRLQQSVGNTTTWTDVSGGTGTSSTTGTGTFAYRDGQDNVSIYYRVGIKTGEYVSGTAVATLSFPFGATTGVARVTAFTSSTVVDIEVLDNFGAITATDEWAEGAWSDYRGHPKGIGIFSGRLWNGFNDQYWGSGSDLYESQFAGDEDADAIAGTLSVGASSPKILWLLGLNRLMVGTALSSADVSPIKVSAGLITIGSSALDEALTPANTNVRSESASAVYVDRSAHTAMELSPGDSGAYAERSLMRLHKDIGRPGLVQLAFAMRPDARLFMVRADGQCLVKLFDRGENVFGWSRIITDGNIKSVAVLPGEDEDEVYFLVDRDDDAQPWQLEKMDTFYLQSADDANRVDSYIRADVPRIWTAAGNAQIDTAQSKFGGTSALFDGTGDYFSTPTNADFDLGSGDWTVDAWFNLVGLTTVGGNICGKSDAAITATETAFFVGRTAGDAMQLQVSDGATIATVVGTTQFTNVLNTGWHHIAAVRTGNTLKLFINGVQEGGDVAFAGSVNDSPRAFVVGARADDGGSIWNGWINEFRLSVGTARWTANFTPPTAAYTADSYTRILLHFDGADAATTFTDAGRSLALGGLSHLEGKSVKLWGDGAYMGTQTVSGGSVTFSSAKLKRAAGLNYRGRDMSSRLAVGAQAGTALAQQGRAVNIAFLLNNSTRAIRFGQDFETMDELPDRGGDATYDSGTGLVTETTDWHPLPGGFSRDSRVCLEVQSPFPVTISGYVIPHSLAEKVKA